MTRLRRTAGLASAALLTFALSACGGSDYCDALESSQDDLGGFSMESLGDPEQVSQAQERFQEIADAAPDDVADTWQSVADAFQLIVDADGDLASIDPEEMSQFESMEGDMTALSENVEEECDIDMSL